jgi:hypothetical protein
MVTLPVKPAAGTEYGSADAALIWQAACAIPGAIRKAARAARMARFFG